METRTTLGQWLGLLALIAVVIVAVIYVLSLGVDAVSQGCGCADPAMTTVRPPSLA